MFNLTDYYSFHCVPSLDAILNIDTKAIENDAQSLEDTLHNLHNLLGKDYVLVVTDDGVKIMTEEQ